MSRPLASVLCAALYAWSVLCPWVAYAQASTTSVLPTVAVAVPISGSSVAYGDIIDYDGMRGAYVLSQYPDDSHVFGVAVKDPPLLITQGSSSTVPVAKDGAVLLNVTLENGPISEGDDIIASSIPGMGMRANEASLNPVGIALEPFDGTASSSRSVTYGTTTTEAGSIVVELDAGRHSVVSTSVVKTLPPSGQICLWQCVPFGTLMRYLTAALVAFGSVYLAFRTFMADAVNGVLSIGRNPRARASIQSMVVFNAVLAALLALAGLVAGVVILFIQL